MTTIVLPFPMRVLSPNVRSHWAPIARAKKDYRAMSHALALHAGAKAALAGAQAVSVHLAFHPPDNRRRDADNLIASMKAALDGIADAIGIDDSRFRLTHEIAQPTDNCVRVTLAPIAPIATNCPEA